MHKPIKYAEKAVTMAAGAAWQVFNTFNSIKPNPSFTPKWSEKPLLKSWEKQKPPLGWPPAWLAPHDGFSLSEMRAGDSYEDRERRNAG
jgi:hypothetical protein